MQENSVEEMNSCYWQRQKLPTGQMAPVEVQPPNESLTVEQLGNAEIYSMIARTFEGEYVRRRGNTAPHGIGRQITQPNHHHEEQCGGSIPNAVLKTARNLDLL